MDTNSDYFFALRLQRYLIDFPYDESDSDVTDSTESNAGNVIDLTGGTVKKRKLSDTEKTPSGSCQKNRKLKTDQNSIVDPSLDVLDPNPDIHSLFLTFNRQYFWGALDSVVVQWSKRMTVCAGLCRYDKGMCNINLSEPLLKLRPRKDLVETLLHEMIHAYLFIIKDKNHSDRDGHGPEFCKHMYRINMMAGTNISIYHTFHDEVRLYKQHWWKCNGPCQHIKPFYGYVKRSVNRAPGPYDKWWAGHKAICDGSFIKVKEPEGYGVKKKSAASQTTKKIEKPANKITNFFEAVDTPTKQVPKDNKVISKSIESKQVQQDDQGETTLCPICNDPVFTDLLNYHLQNCNQLKEMFGDDKISDECKCPACNERIDRNRMNEHLDSCKMLGNVFENDLASIPDQTKYINCPICNKSVRESNINAHLDICLSVESSEPDTEKNLITCPCCVNTFESVEELDNHIDICSM